MSNQINKTMNIFEFESKLVEDTGDCNIIYFSKDRYRVTTLTGRSNLSEVESVTRDIGAGHYDKLITYKNAEQLQKSEQLIKYSNLPSVLVVQTGTDCSKWLAVMIVVVFDAKA